MLFIYLYIVHTYYIIYIINNICIYIYIYPALLLAACYYNIIHRSVPSEITHK